ncbi:serine threonine- kinase pats1 [Brachionus plicatilis]|uniref:Serine threonine-kinase pats1 n=1 Tax=Brachionus plicatilis TaxID=10195 RepID=A0A3M7SPL0_BRAPC|nr:serine threonine- kinase pats1 [Brachionus plicatilis]
MENNYDIIPNSDVGSLWQNVNHVIISRENDCGSLKIENKIENLVDIDVLNNSDYYKQETLDLSGKKNVTDLLFWKLHQNFAGDESHKVKIPYNFILNGCSNISICLPSEKLNNFLSCCPKISESLMVSLNYNSETLYINEHLFDHAKCVIINSDNFSPNLIEKIDKSLANLPSQIFFRYSKIKSSKNKFLNIFECNQSLADFFTSERNLAVLTYDTRENEEKVLNSILSRLLMMMAKNILPCGILVLGVGQGDQNLIEKLQKNLHKSLDKIKKKLKKTIDTYLNNLSEINIHSQIELSNQLNLNEHIDLVLNILNFGIIDPEKNHDVPDRFTCTKIRPKNEKVLSFLKENLAKMEETINKLNRKNLASMKGFTAPPSAVQSVGEAICYLFARPPNYQNFAKIINSNDFIIQLKNFDLNTVNDYKLKHLKDYVQMQNFNPTYIGEISIPASMLCEWVLSVYNYCSNVKLLQIFSSENYDFHSISKSSYATLSSYLYDNSFYMFKWHLYYEDKYENSEKEIDELIKKSIDLKNKPILTIDELNQLFLANEKLKDYQSNQFKQLSLRYARAQSARGRFFFNEKTKFIITDLIWLKSIFDILANKETNESHLNDILGIPVWNINELKEELKKLCPNDQIFDYLISFLKENSLIIVTDKEEIIPIFCLSKNQNSAFDKWSDKWSDLEYKVSWELFSPLPFNVFSEFVSMFFNSRTCIKLRKNGFLYQDTHFDALIRYSKREVQLSVRMLDPERYFNLADRSFLDHFKTAYMKFYIYLKYLIFKSSSVYLLKLDSQCFKHLIFNGVEDRESKNIYEKVWSSELSSSQNLLEISQHNFEKNDKDESKCSVCDMKFYNFKKLKKAYFELYMNFFEVPLGRVPKKMPDHLFKGNNDQLYSYLPKIYDVNENYCVFILDFTSEKMVQDFFICLSEDTVESSEIWINLQKMEIKSVKTKNINVSYSLLSEESDLNNQLSMGDVVKIEFLKETKSATKIKLRLNGLILLEVECIDCNLVPHFGVLSDTLGIKSEFRKNLKKNSQLKIHYFKDRLNCLIDHYLEVRNRKKSNYFTTAKISIRIDVKDNSVLVHLTRENCDYWAEISDLDLRPAGCQIENKNIKFYSLINSNKLNHEFDWNEFLEKNSFKAVPFDLFTIEQKSGMDPSEFKGNNDYITQRPCLWNSEKYIQYMNDYMKQKSICMIEKQVKMKYDQITAPLRGLLLLPQNSKDLVNPNKYSLLDDLKIHMCCMTRLNDDQTLYAHLLNAKGISIKKEMINMNDLVVILISSYLVFNSKFESIVPDNCQIFDDQDSNFDEHALTKHIRDYLKYLFEELSIFLNLCQMESKIFTVNLKKYHPIATSKQESIIYKFEKSPTPLGRCYYCFLADYKYSHSSRKEYSLNEKINEYSKFCLHFGIIASNRILNLEAKFAKNFPNLIELILVSVPLEITDQNFFQHFENLIHLKLWNNNLDSIPKSIFKLEKLKSFSFFNRIDADCLKFGQMKSLETLELENLEIKDPNQKVRLSGEMKNLKIARSSFSHFIFKLRPAKVINLKLIGVPIFDLKKCLKNSSIIGKESFTREISKTKLLNSDQSKKLFEYFDSNSNGYLEPEEILKLNAFLFKKFLRLGPDLPSIIFQMTYLETLDLSFQSIEQIPDEIENLKNLYSLILNNCILLQSVSPKLANLSLIKLSLSNCLSLVTPPPEIVDRGMDSVMAYLKRLISGSVELKRTKLMLVGLGQAGKTSLAQALKGFKKEKCDVTDGISIDDWHVDLDDGSQLSFSMWDFAGQSVYYNTHQFFLSSRSIYLLVWNVRLGSEYAGLEFWLSSISCHSPSAPVVIVGTHIDQVIDNFTQLLSKNRLFL